MTRPWRPLVFGLLVCGSLALATGAAHAGIEPGDVAPDFEGKEFFNTDPVCLQDLRGRLVLFELFSTG